MTPKFPRNPGFVGAVRKQALLPERDIARALGKEEDAYRLLRHLASSGALNRRDCIRMWADGFATTGIDLHNLSQARLGPFLFVGGLGLLLGMRHSSGAERAPGS